MKRFIRPPASRILLALAACGFAGWAALAAGPSPAPAYDPLFDQDGGLCAPVAGGPPPLLKALVLAAAETAPFQPAPMKAAGGDVPLFHGLGDMTLSVGTKDAKARAYFEQGVRLAFAFNHAEAQRSFQAAQRLDPACALCYWGEALVLGPNINVPMMPEANPPALSALAKAAALSKAAPERDRALIEALAARYSADPRAERPALDAAYADAMRAVAARWPADDTVQALYAESAMDTQPWDYWEAAGARPKGRTADILATLEAVLKRNPAHAGAIHLYIHMVEASTAPERALPYARKLGDLMPGAGHIVHMPAHIYYRLGMYRESLAANELALVVDEHYFELSPSDPLYKSAYYPHNIHFLMVSAQMRGDGRRALAAAAKLDAAIPLEVVRKFAIMQPVKAAPYTTHAQFADPDETLKLPAPAEGLALVSAYYHYARAVAFAQKKDAAGAQREIDALAKLGRETDFKPFDEWGIPAKDIVETARLVAAGRLADAKGDLAAAAKAYEDAIFIEDTLAYTEPPYWYYPIRQSLGSVRLRQGRLDEAEKAFRDSLARVRGNGWALAGLAEVYRLKGKQASDVEAKKAYLRSRVAALKAFTSAWFERSPPDLSRL
jgi:tetratricopeptide (TPR) repeat protein